MDGKHHGLRFGGWLHLDEPFAQLRRQSLFQRRVLRLRLTLRFPADTGCEQRHRPSRADGRRCGLRRDGKPNPRLRASHLQRHHAAPAPRFDLRPYSLPTRIIRPRSSRRGMEFRGNRLRRRQHPCLRKRKPSSSRATSAMPSRMAPPMARNTPVSSTRRGTSGSWGMVRR